MKKLFWIVVWIMVLLLLLAGCRSEPEPLRVCVDIEHAEMFDPNNLDAMLFEFQNTLKQSGGLTDVEIERIPKEGAERESMLKRIRAELMAGEGPDVFIVKYDTLGFGDPLFPLPEEAMANDFFLPLDTYMEEQTQFAEWDKLTPAVMEAGRDEEGQQIIPLAYKTPVLYLFGDDSPEVPENMTWSEMLADESLSFEAAMLSDLCRVTQDGEVTSVGVSNDLEFILGDFADYETEKLNFTEEELYGYVCTMLDLQSKAQNGAYTDIPLHSESALTVTQSSIRRDLGIGAEEPWEMVSLCSVDGGYTALVTAYAAVNRNTERPEDAFTVIDLLMRTQVQQNYRLFTEALLWDGFPMHEELLSAEYPAGVLDDTVGEAQFAEICELREGITSAHFRSVLSEQMQMMLYECETAAQNGGSVQEIVSEYYRKMKQMLAE